MALANNIGGWKITYTQNDVNTIREQIVDEQASRRRSLVMMLLVTAGLLAGTIVLLTSSYALYAGAESDKEKIAAENAALKADLTKYRQELEARNAEDRKQAEARAAFESRLDKLRPAASGGGDVAALAQLIYTLPHHRLELDRQPSNKILRNWKVQTESGTEVYTLVGGFVDGKWILYSNLIAR